MTDSVNPPHYKSGRQFEVIDIIEDNICRTDEPVCGFLQGQVLRYICRIWDKGDPLENALKAEWYLKRLISQFDVDPDEKEHPFNYDYNYEDIIRFSEWKAEADDGGRKFEADDQLILG